MKQLTLVVLYGEKAPALRSLIASCQGIASSALGRTFTPYGMTQIHATIIGFEHSKAASRQNANFQRLRGESVEMDIPGFLGELSACSEIPFPVQIGGFAEQDRSFLSRGNPPWLRAFSIHGDKAVLIGGPFGADSKRAPMVYPQTLDIIQRRAQRFGILHTYHGSDTDVDNDFFFRIGLVGRGAVSDAAVSNLELKMRQYLSELSPLVSTVGLDDLRVAAYRDERLPVSSTEIWPISDLDSDGKDESVASWLIRSGTCFT